MQARECGAKTRDGDPCHNPPVTGANRCRMHGGKSLRGENSPTYKHGRDSRYMQAEIMRKLETVEEEGDPLDLVPELDLQRALLGKFLSNFREGHALSAYEIGFMIDWSESIGRTAERIVKMRNSTALTAAEIALIASRLPEIVARFIDDPYKQNAFLDALFSGLGYADESQPRQLADGGADE